MSSNPLSTATPTAQTWNPAPMLTSAQIHDIDWISCFVHVLHLLLSGLSGLFVFLHWHSQKHSLGSWHRWQRLSTSRFRQLAQISVAVVSVVIFVLFLSQIFSKRARQGSECAFPGWRQLSHLSKGALALTTWSVIHLRLGAIRFTFLIFVSQGMICSWRAASALQRDFSGNMRIDRPVARAQPS